MTDEQKSIYEEAAAETYLSTCENCGQVSDMPGLCDECLDAWEDEQGRIERETLNRWDWDC